MSSSGNNGSLSSATCPRTGKFIGGATARRLSATKAPPLNSKKKSRPAGTRILNPIEREAQQETLKHLSPYERFYASLLRSEATDYVSAKNTRVLLQTVCQRCMLTCPTTKVPESHTTQRGFFAARASLVLEESRFNVAEGIRNVHNRLQRMLNSDSRDANKHNSRHHHHHHHNNKNGNKRKRASPFDASDSSNGNANVTDGSEISGLIVTSSVFKEKTGHSLISFSKPDVATAGKKTKKSNGAAELTGTTNPPNGGGFTYDEMQTLRQGTVVALYDTALHPSIRNVLLALVLPQSREDIVELTSFKVMVFRKAYVKISSRSSSTLALSSKSSSSWTVLPVTCLLTSQREFESCSMLAYGKKLPFVSSLLGGMKASLHLRFRTDSNGDMHTVQNNKKGKNNVNNGEYLEESKMTLKEARKIYVFPNLNKSQEEAARTFLNSNDGSLTLCQGPPGTGKTTVITATICRYLLMHRHYQSKRRLMVTAPTNKAVMILCSSFLSTIQTETPPSIVLLGEEDKLFEDQKYSSSRGVRSVFLYSWLDTVESDLKQVAKTVRTARGNGNKVALQIARSVLHRVNQSLKSEKTIIESLNELVKILEGTNSSSTMTAKEVVDLVQMLHLQLREKKEKSELTMIEIVQNADIVFCTCATAGTTILKKALDFDIDDLIIDEAAATTESLLSIPFCFYPKNVFAVGDPAQLPAMVSSPLAKEFGLSVSMHERLMSCGHPFSLLDVQYRMATPISSWPSREFYAGKLKNGENVTSSSYKNAVTNIGNGPYTFFDVQGGEAKHQNGSYYNVAEALAVQRLVADLSRSVSPNRIKVITYYSAQANMIRNKLAKRFTSVNVGTVDSAQGSEADVCIVSIVRTGSSRKSGTHSVGFLSDRRRLNVSLTRARHQLILLGNFRNLSSLTGDSAMTIKSLVMDASRRGVVVPFRMPGQTYEHIYEPPSESIPDQSDRPEEEEPRKRHATDSRDSGEVARVSFPAANKSGDAEVVASVTNTTSSSSCGNGLPPSTSSSSSSDDSSSSESSSDDSSSSDSSSSDSSSSDSSSDSTSIDDSDSLSSSSMKLVKEDNVIDLTSCASSTSRDDDKEGLNYGQQVRNGDVASADHSGNLDCSYLADDSGGGEDDGCTQAAKAGRIGSVGVGALPKIIGIGDHFSDVSDDDEDGTQRDSSAVDL